VGPRRRPGLNPDVANCDTLEFSGFYYDIQELKVRMMNNIKNGPCADAAPTANASTKPAAMMIRIG